MSEPTPIPQTQWLFVDEAGDPTLFQGKGKVIVDSPGCSRYFMVGKLEVDDPPALSAALEHLRADMVLDPYFGGVESFRPERKKTALLFHAKDDMPEVRYRVLCVLREAGDALRFHAVVCDKLALLAREARRRQETPGYRYQPDAVYDGLIRSLFSKLHRLADRYEVCIARRGAKDRTQALQTAVEHAERDFEQRFGFRRASGDAWGITVSDPRQEVCLQAVDYFLWALQRFYEVRRNATTGEEIREERFLRMLWPQIGEIHDLDFGRAGGSFYNKNRPLTIVNAKAQCRNGLGNEGSTQRRDDAKDSGQVLSVPLGSDVRPICPFPSASLRLCVSILRGITRFAQ